MRLLLSMMIMLLPALAVADPVRGVVVIDELKCRKLGYIVIDAPKGYVYAQVWSGSFKWNDTVVGDLESFGFKDVMVNEKPARLWIDDYWLSRSRAWDKCRGK